MTGFLKVWNTKMQQNSMVQKQKEHYFIYRKEMNVEAAKVLQEKLRGARKGGNQIVAIDSFHVTT